MNYRKLLLHFCGLVLPLLVLVELFHYVDRNNELDDLRVTDARLVEEIGARVRVHLSGIAADLLMLSHSHQVMDYLDKPSAATVSRLQESFITFSNAYGKYDQVRLLDIDGQEKVRVNHGPGGAILVPAEQLQNKAHRYYFEKARPLGDGEIYVSPFDLNLEQGEIETPWKPVIRLSTPVFDREKRLKGFLVLNYLGQSILDEVSSSNVSSRGDIMMINDRGFWLYYAHEEKSWGFMFGNDSRFSQHYPSAWERLRVSEEGQFETQEGMFSFITLSPPEIIGQDHSFFVNDEGWKLVSAVPASQLTRSADQRLQVLYNLSPLFILVLALAAWLWTRVADEAQQGRVRIKQFYRVVEQSEELVFITDPDACIQYVNPAFERITGYTQAEVIGKKPSILKSEAHGDAYYKRLWRTILSGKPFKGVFVNKRKDGSFYYEEKIISPIHDGRGKIIQFVSTGRDVSELNTMKNRGAEIGKLIDCDTLTKLPNRISIIDHLKQALIRAEQTKSLVALAIIDLDGFDWVNETYGHYKGDQLLISFAQRVQKCMRKNDLLGRLGGDEFVILMTDFDSVEEIEHHLEIALVTATTPYVLDGTSIEVNANIGVVLHQLGKVDHNTLLIQANNAIQQAKKSGKNQIAVVTDATAQQTEEETYSI